MFKAHCWEVVGINFPMATMHVNTDAQLHEMMKTIKKQKRSSNHGSKHETETRASQINAPLPLSSVAAPPFKYEVAHGCTTEFPHMYAQGHVGERNQRLGRNLTYSCKDGFLANPFLSRFCSLLAAAINPNSFLWDFSSKDVIHVRAPNIFITRTSMCGKVGLFSANAWKRKL